MRQTPNRALFFFFSNFFRFFFRTLNFFFELRFFLKKLFAIFRNFMQFFQIFFFFCEWAQPGGKTVLNPATPSDHPLAAAIAFGRSERVVRFLIGLGADVTGAVWDERDTSRPHPLHVALVRGRLGAARALMEAGALGGGRGGKRGGRLDPRGKGGQNGVWNVRVFL
jgi:hypothetical protein